MKYLWKFICDILGHSQPGILVYRNMGVVVYCPRCYEVLAGEVQRRII